MRLVAFDAVRAAVEEKLPVLSRADPPPVGIDVHRNSREGGDEAGAGVHGGHGHVSRRPGSCPGGTLRGLWFRKRTLGGGERAARHAGSGGDRLLGGIAGRADECRGALGGGRDRARKVHHASDHDEKNDRSSRDDVPANHVQRKTGRGGEE